MQVLEVDVLFGQALQQRGDTGFLAAHIERVDQRVAVLRQFQRQVG